MEFKEIPDAYKSIRSDVSRAIESKSSIELVNIEDMNFAITLLEEAFKGKKVRYRIKTDKRASVPGKVATGGAAIIGASVAVEAAAVAAPIAVASLAIAGAALTGIGAIALTGIAAHRIFTANPDYEVIKYPALKKIGLVYKK